MNIFALECNSIQTKHVLQRILTNQSLAYTMVKLNTEILVLFKLIILLLAHELEDLKGWSVSSYPAKVSGLMEGAVSY